MEALENVFKSQTYTEIFWKSRKLAFEGKTELEKKKAITKCNYINHLFNANIPITKRVSRFIAPHGFKGISISNFASIGENCIIYQNATIGSNTLLDSKTTGAPVIGNNVMIGAGATVIGNVKIGNNVRIGAGCFVNKDVEDNCTVIQGKPVTVKKTKLQDNRYIPAGEFFKTRGAQIKKSGAKIYKTLKREEEEKYNNAFKILFSGDLILLEDQVKNAFQGEKYDFKPIFEYAKPYIQSANFSIGPFEGPCGGTEKKYSQSNFGDGKKLYLNFPDEFIDDVKEAGFDLVTVGTNHLLDMGIEGAKRSLQKLKEKGLDYTGAYFSFENKEEERVKIVEKEGIKMAVLSYVSIINGVNTNEFLKSENSYLTSYIVPSSNPNFEDIKNSIKADFEKAKSYNPDLIIVLPHWGTQFSDEADNFQKLWRKIFIEFGADIIFGDHTHSTQPVIIEEYRGKTVYTLYSPGNFANIYRKHNGDASALVEVYIERETKKIIGSSIIPMWTTSPQKGNYRAIPVYEILNNEKLGLELSTYDTERVKEVYSHITRTMMNEELNLNMAQKRCFWDGKNFLRKKVDFLVLDEEMKSSKFYKALTNSYSVCFVGDSITEGTLNGGVPWFEPFENLIKGEIFNCGWGSSTVKRLLAGHINEIADKNADLFVVAIGTNDVRYRVPSICALTKEEYKEKLKEIKNKILEKRQNAKFVFVAPWTSTDGDRNSKLPYAEKIKMYEEYSKALEEFCIVEGDIFINPNPYITKHLDLYPRENYLLDAIHPNAKEGVNLYARAVFKS